MAESKAPKAPSANGSAKAAATVIASDNQSSDWRAALKDIVSGTVGGIAQTIAGHPLDTVKVRLQTQVTLPGQEPQFTGMRDCIAKTWKAETRRYHGTQCYSFLLFWPEKAMRIGQSSGDLSLERTFIVGGIAGIVTSMVETPADLFKVKLQAQVGSGQFNGVFDAARKIYTQYGIRGCYQGLSGTLMRNVPAFALYFWSNEGTRRALTPIGQLASLTTCFIGGVSGFAFWGLLYPTGIKTRLQADALNPAERQYRGWVDCAVKSVKEQGVKGLFRGYVPCVVRAVPVNATVFLTVTAAKRQMAKYITPFIHSSRFACISSYSITCFLCTYVYYQFGWVDKDILIENRSIFI